MAKASKAKNISAGVGGKGKKAPMVDPKGAWTKVQQRTIDSKSKKK
jgi:multidrug resistance efflux pump